MSKNRQRRGGVQSNHNTRFNNRGNRGPGYNRNSGAHINNAYNRDNREMPAPIKPEGIYHNHSILAALSHLVGRTVHVLAKNDNMYEGVFCTVSPKAAFVLKCVHKLEKKHANGCNGITSPQQLPCKDDINRELIFDFRDIISISGKIEKANVRDEKDKFVVDSEVSKRRPPKTEPKELQKWTDGTDIHQSLNEISLDAGSGNGWTYEDMIRTNEEKFNVSSVYDENMSEYTVPVPDCDEETKRKAAQLADDIERKVTANVHIAEERGQIIPMDMTEEERYSSVVRPAAAQYIEITEARKRYSDIPAPLSQVDEPTEDVFKEEKEAALNKLQKEAAGEPVIPETPKCVAETKKCVVETQTDAISPKKSSNKIASPSTSTPSSPQVPKHVDSNKVESPVPAPLQASSPIVPAQASPRAAAHSSPAALKSAPAPSSVPPHSVSHTVQQIKKEEPVKQIMKSDQARKEERKEGLINFKAKFEDSTQSRGPKSTSHMQQVSTVAQTTALPPQIVQQVSQQPVAGGHSGSHNNPHHSHSGHHQHPGNHPHSGQHQHGGHGQHGAQQQMMQKQRNDSMSSESSYTMGQQYQQQPRQHSLPHIPGTVYSPAVLQHQHQMQLQHQLQLHQQQQLQIQQAHMQHQQQQHAIAAANNQHAVAAAAAQQFQGNASMQAQAYHQALVHQQHQQHSRQMQQQEQKQTALNPDAVEFKPGSSVTSSPIPQPKQVLIQQSHFSQQSGPDNKGNVVVVPQPQLAVIPNPQGVMSQYATHHGPPLVVPIYPTSTLMQRGYLAPAAMQAHSVAAMAQHNAMVSQGHHDQTTPPGGVMSPTSPTTQPQIIYHPQQQIVSHGQYIQHQMNNAHMLQLQSGQLSQNPQAGGPYANPLQPHHPAAAVFPYPPNVG